VRFLSSFLCISDAKTQRAARFGDLLDVTLSKAARYPASRNSKIYLRLEMESYFWFSLLADSANYNHAYTHH
jgi:hypothetical protein